MSIISSRLHRTTSVVLATSLVALTVITGCSPNKEEAATGGGSTAGGSTSGFKLAIIGAGSTFVNPAMGVWVAEYKAKNPGVSINYQSVGSGAGIAQYTAGTVDFGATDAPLSDKELADVKIPTVQVPIVLGCAVMAYNLPGVPTGLKLTSENLADLYMGKIKTWNDPKITAENPGVNLPATAVTIVHRSDGSGTTFVFTDYLSSVSAAWKAGPGKGKTVNWPMGIGGKGSEGVAGVIKQTPGAIGYVELAYAVQTNETFASLKNKAGTYVVPNPESTSAAADANASALKADIRTSLVNSDGKGAYPIAGFTYGLLSKAPKDAAKSKAVVDFMKWAMGPGQEVIGKLQYAPLPKSVVDLNNTAISEIKAG